MCHARLFLVLLLVLVSRIPSPSESLRVVVVGAGPVGLLHAIHAAQLNIKHVTILEKRHNYTRQVWFDLYPLPWYPSIQILGQLGHINSSLYHTSHIRKGMKAITIQAKTLEHFLTDIATSHGVHILKNTEFQSIQFSKHKDMPHKAIAMDTEKNTSLEIQFDILVGADGAKSAVRNAAQIRFKEIDTFRDVFSGQLVNHKGLKQVAVVVDFKRIKKEDKWICPPEREFDVLSGEKLHPWFAGFYNDQITTVFKRFYFDHCQMQIFLNQDTGNSLLNSNSSESVWNLIWNVSKIYLDVEYENVSNLKRATYESSVNILPIQIFSAEHTAQVIMGDRPAVLLLVGDASFTAYFRLGVGVNTGFAGLESFQRMLYSIMMKGLIDTDSAQALTDVVEKRERKYKDKLERMVDLQLSTMFFESVCDLAVFFEPFVADISDSQRIYFKDRQNLGFEKASVKSYLDVCSLSG